MSSKFYNIVKLEKTKQKITETILPKRYKTSVEGYNAAIDQGIANFIVKKEK